MEYNSTQKKYLLAIIVLCSISLSLLWFKFIKTCFFNNIEEKAEGSYATCVTFVDSENVLGFGGVIANEMSP